MSGTIRIEPGKLQVAKQCLQSEAESINALAEAAELRPKRRLPVHGRARRRAPQTGCSCAPCPRRSWFTTRRARTARPFSPEWMVFWRSTGGAPGIRAKSNVGLARAARGSTGGGIPCSGCPPRSTPRASTPSSRPATARTTSPTAPTCCSPTSGPCRGEVRRGVGRARRRGGPQGQAAVAVALRIA